MLESFWCKNFRCFLDRHFVFDKNFTIINGKNGSGKTSILEGIYLSVRGKSFLTGKNSNLVKRGMEYFSLKTIFEGNEIKAFYSVKEGKRVLSLNGKMVSSGEISHTFPLFVFNGRLINAIRKDLVSLYKFFNIILSLYDRTYMKEYMEYKRALNEKRALLTSKTESDTIFSWNRIISFKSDEIRKKRILFVKKINSYLEGDISILYKIKDKKEEERLLFKREIEQGRILTGCHRDRFFIFKDNEDLRFFYSSGQQKNIFFKVIRAVGNVFFEKTGKNPVLLLDDFDSELDVDNLEECLKSVLNRFQIVLTTTDVRKFKTFNHSLIEL